MEISIASDHAGFEQKQLLAEYLSKMGHTVFDLGPQNDERVDYPDFAEKVAMDIKSGKSQRGVLVCGTGIGMAVSANKISGIRAANINNVEFAKLCRAHNDCQIICLSGRFVSLEDNEAILDAFLNTSFEGGRHADRVAKIMSLEGK